VQRILSKDITSEVIDEDGGSSIEAVVNGISPTVPSTESPPTESTVRRLWEELKRDVEWETEEMRNEFEKLEEAILRRVQLFLGGQQRRELEQGPRSSRHVDKHHPLPKSIGRIIEKKVRKKGAKGAKGREKRNLLTDLISPHMRWDEGDSSGAGGVKLTYKQFQTIATQLVSQLKIDREMVHGAERETADAIISALEELLAGDEAMVTALLHS